MLVKPADLIPGDVLTDGRTVMECLPANPNTGNPVTVLRAFLGWETRTVEWCSRDTRVEVRRTGTTY